MSFPAGPPFNPPVSKVPILGASSGNPMAYKDPNSSASLGRKLQAMNDQASADTLYDAPPSTVEGFRNEIYSPWILKTEACSKEGFKMQLTPSDYEPYLGKEFTFGIALLAIGGVSALFLSFSKKNRN
jgi:hypothetical protein